jgi:ABC-2 type transport system permease protein
MNVVFAIAWRDFKNLFLAPMMQLILAFCAVLMTFFFIRNLFMFAERARAVMSAAGDGPNIQMEVFAQHISVVHLLMILICPVLTMRLIAEEKKLKTFDLLLTSPITAAQIAIGKYLAGCMSAFTVIFVSFLYPVATASVATFPWAPLFTAYLGLILVIAIYVAVGLFASSLSESIVLSVVLGWIFSLLVFFVGQAGVNNSDPLWSAVFDQISLAEHFYGFILGTIKTKSIVYFMSAIAFFVLLTERVVESARWR